MKKVILVSKKKAFSFKWVDKKSSKCSFLYLGDDYCSYLKLQEKFRDGNTIKTLKSQFHDSIHKLQEDYLYFCHKINKKNASDNYWSTALGSRSSPGIPLLKNLIYCYCGKEQINMIKQDETIYIIFDFFPVGEILLQEAKKNNCNSEFHSLFTEKFNFFLEIFKLLPNTIYYLLRFFIFWLFTRIQKNIRMQHNQDKIILFSWMTKGCFDKSGNYKDRNFGPLEKYLLKNNKDAWVCPTYFNLGKSVFKTIRLMSKSETNFAFVEQYIPLWSCFSTLWIGIQNIFIDLSDSNFANMDVSPLLKTLHIKYVLDPGILRNNGIFQFMRYMGKANSKISKIIYPIENNLFEKPLIVGCKKYLNETEIIGFQHTVWVTEQLGMFLHPEESSYHPLPHKIICSGRKYLDILPKAGFPENLLYLGANLRYGDVNASPPSPHGQPLSIHKILVLFHFDLSQVLEMLYKLKIALNNNRDFAINLKPHPLINMNIVRNFLTSINFPQYQVVSGTVQQHVINSSMVITTYGSVSNLEVMSLGVPLIRVSLDNNFDYDPLWDKYLIPLKINDPKDLRDAIFSILNNMRQDEFIKYGKYIQREYFEPITNERLSIFLT